MLGLDKLLKLLMVLDETTASVDDSLVTSVMAISTSLRGPVNLQSNPIRVLRVVASRTMALLTSDPRLLPCTNQTGQSVLVALWFVTRGVTRPTIVWLVLLPGVVTYPSFICAEHIVGEVILSCSVRITCDDVSV